MNNEINEINETKPVQRKQPTKKSFDMEYATQFRRERDYLDAIGIAPSFTKTDVNTGIRTYKYKKTAELFEALLKFYNAYEQEKEGRAV